MGEDDDASRFGPIVGGPINRPRTGRRPITSKYEPLTTPALTTRGSPSPIIVNAIVEKSPNVAIDFTRALRSSISGTEKVVFVAASPGALCRM